MKAIESQERIHFADLLPLLTYLDRLIEHAVTAARTVYGPNAATDPYRGLYVTPAEADMLLTRQPGASAIPRNGLHVDRLSDGIPSDSRIITLQRLFGLSDFDLEIVLIALGPELDLRYERLYGYLQDDVTRRRPSVDLALTLLCASREERLSQRSHFGPTAPLVRHSLVHLVHDGTAPEPPLLSHSLKLDEQVVDFLLGHNGPSPQIAPYSQVIEPSRDVSDLPHDFQTKRTMSALFRDAWKRNQTLRLVFTGPTDSTKRKAAEALAGELGAPLLLVDLYDIPHERSEFQRSIASVFREATLQRAILCLEGWDDLPVHEPLSSRSFHQEWLLRLLLDSTGVTVLCAEIFNHTLSRDGLNMIDVPFPIPNIDQRRDWTQTVIDREGVSADASSLDTFAERFQLTPDRIIAAVGSARDAALWRLMGQQHNALSETAIPITRDDLFAAARAQSELALGALARKIEPVYRWGDIVLPDDTLAQLQELCGRVTYGSRVLEDWGFSRKLSLGKGLTALFTGPSGTGKTMAAEIIANELGLDLYKIDLSNVVSKYIGETEKNLGRIFAEATDANAILFFDEADALFGKRSEVHDAHDRYANIEVNYLLQEMESYEGIAILATNLRRNMDDAFVRRLAFAISFPQPTEEDRLRIWQSIWPDETPLDVSLDLPFMASQFNLTGGHIRNIALAAAFLAAEEGLAVGMSHIIWATRREFRKMGKVVADSEFSGYASATDREVHDARI